VGAGRLTPLTDLREYDRAARWQALGVLAEVRQVRPPAEPREPLSEEAMYGAGMALAFALAAWVVCGAPLP
jgi:hypothetical protein